VESAFTFSFSPIPQLLQYHRHGRPQGGKRAFAPPWKLRLKDQKFLEILKSAT